jgi:hypothetical protein
MNGLLRGYLPGGRKNRGWEDNRLRGRGNRVGGGRWEEAVEVDKGVGMGGGAVYLFNSPAGPE